MKLSFLASDNEEAFNAIRTLKTRYGNVKPAEAEAIIVLGGDGFMLECLHKYEGIEAPFFGINYGSVGFLLNPQSDKDLIGRIEAATSVKLTPLKMIAKDWEGNTHEAYAYNEVSMLRESRQTAKIEIKVDGKVQLEELMCDGVLVATAAGSTAYNLSAQGPIIPLQADILALTPISAFRPRRWRGALLPSSAQITFTMHEPEKRPMLAVADFTEIRDVVEVEVRESTTRCRTLLFDPGHSLEDRILKEQFVS